MGSKLTFQFVIIVEINNCDLQQRRTKTTKKEKRGW